MKKAILILCLLASTSLVFSQSAIKPYDPDYYHLIERYQIKQKHFFGNFHTTFRPLSGQEIAIFVDSVGHSGMELSQVDRFNLTYLANDNWEWMPDMDSALRANTSKRPLFGGKVYQTKSDMWMVHKKGEYDIHVSPLYHGTVTLDNDAVATPYLNQRGAVIRGSIGEKIGFYLEGSDTQFRPAHYVKREMTVRRGPNSVEPIFGEGFYKGLQSVKGGYEFYNARGHITFGITPYIQAQFGHGKQFIGNGYRSLVLSNFSDDYTSLRLNTKIWKLQYTNLFAKLTADNRKFNTSYPVKYLALHRLGINLSKSFNIGFYEAIITSRHDSTGGNGFDISYLNPVMFYRSMEHDLGDADNALLGMDFLWNVAKGVQIYGQLHLDELKVSELLGGDGWWGNKHGLQLGGKYIDAFGVKNLDLQCEINHVRPFTYTHYSVPGQLSHQMYTNYQHYNQALAHPLGANFQELVGIARWQPINKLRVTAKLFYAVTGGDKLDEQFRLVANHGSNILLDYVTRDQEYDVRIGHGVRATWMMADLTAIYMIKHNVFLDLKLIYRDYNSEDDFRDLTSQNVSFSVRWNVGQRLFEL